MSAQDLLVVVLILFFIAFGLLFGMHSAKRGSPFPNALQLGIGFVTNFFDTLGIGSFAPTTSMFKAFKVVPDERIPGTLNVGHTPPTIVEALLFIGLGSAVTVDERTLILLIVAAVLGAWLGAGVVARWSRRNVQIGMGIALIAAASIFIMQNLHVLPGGGTALALTGVLLWIGLVGSFILGALMTLGIGLYAPAIIMVSLLGMDPRAAWPIMTGACAFLMPCASWRFVKFDAFANRAAVGLAIAGIPGVILAYWLFRNKLPIEAIKWLAVVVVLYAAFGMLRSAVIEHKARQDYAVTP
jgi:uncharacterized membrane protein YfcA